MELIVGANIFISALISRGKTAEILFSNDFTFYTPEKIIDEIYKYKKEIILKSSLSEEDINVLISLIFSRIKIIPFNEFKSFIEESKKICPDENDVEYFALALKLNCEIWSNDKALKKQEKIEVISTKELIEKLYKE